MLAPYGGARWSEGGAQAPGAPPPPPPPPLSMIGICIIPLLGTSGNGNLRYSREDPAEIGRVGQSVTCHNF